MKSIYSILGLLLVLGGLLLIGCGETAPKPPDAWLTYVNETHGYVIRYPPDCFYGPMPPYCKEKPPQERPPECLCFLDGENPNQVFLQSLTIEGDEILMGAFEISYNDTPAHNPPPDMGLVEWVKRNWLEMHEDIPDEPNMELDGIPAVKVYDSGGMMAPSAETIYFIKDGKLFRLHMLEPDDESNRELYDQLIAGFEFSE